MRAKAEAVNKAQQQLRPEPFFPDILAGSGPDRQALSNSKNVLASRKLAGRGLQFQRPLTLHIKKFEFLIIIDLILEHHVAFLKQMQSLGAKNVLENVAILRHFTDLM